MQSQIWKPDPVTSISLKQKTLEIANNLVNDFELTKDLKAIFNNLFMYFTGNEHVLDLNKGIYLYGVYGVGKTITMQIFSKFLARCFPFSPNGYGITSIEKLAEHYKDNGNLAKYGRNKEDKKPFHLCINEFGKELDEKYYGTNIQNVVNSMIMVRYEMFNFIEFKGESFRR